MAQAPVFYRITSEKEHKKYLLVAPTFIKYPIASLVEHYQSSSAPQTLEDFIHWLILDCGFMNIITEHDLQITAESLEPVF